MNKVTRTPDFDIDTCLSFPGDKSLSHRYALLACFAKGISSIQNFLFAEDTLNLLRSFERLGVLVEYIPEKFKVVITSPGYQNFLKKETELFLGNSGTASRLLMGLLSGIPQIKVSLTGDESLSKRPMKRVIVPLSKFGAKITGTHLPVLLHGTCLREISYVESLGSAQVKSSLMLAGLSSQVSVSIQEEKPSRDHTERLFSYLGLNIEKKGSRIQLTPPYKISSQDYVVLGDISSASFFVVIALLAKSGCLVLKNLLWNPYRNTFISILQKMGGEIRVIEKGNQHGEQYVDLEVYPSQLNGIIIGEELIPKIIDELPILTIAGLYSSGMFSFRNAEELRTKESDRIKGLVINLRSLGITVDEYSDGLSFIGNPDLVLSGDVYAFDDHRIAMSFVVAFLRSHMNSYKSKKLPSLMHINGLKWISTSFPEFWEKLSLVYPNFGLQEFFQNRFIITVDGPAASGKSSLTRILGKNLHLCTLDSGALYRLCTFLAIEFSNSHGLLFENIISSEDFYHYLIDEKLIEVTFQDGQQILFLDHLEVKDLTLRTNEINQHIHFLADNIRIRNFVNQICLDLSKKHSIIADGRDMGTEVFPNAQLKFFLMGDVKERAKRRYLEKLEYDSQASLDEEILALSKRDQNDINRVVGSLVVAKDAIQIDTTNLSFSEVQKKMFDTIFIYLYNRISFQSS